ncbi:MAG: hypothetical protein ACKOWF_10465 [Chloroflexota bacterium]
MITSRDARLFLGGLVGGVALGFLALQAVSRLATGEGSPLAFAALIVCGIGWLAAPPLGWFRGMPAFAAGWSASGVVLALGVMAQVIFAGSV